MSVNFETLALAKEYTNEQVESGVGVVVDNVLSETSMNPVQNKVITKAIKDSRKKWEGEATEVLVEFDRKPYTEIESAPIKDGKITFDTTNKEIYMDNGSIREKYSGNIETDKTLTKNGAPADAKAVGDKLKEKVSKQEIASDIVQIESNKKEILNLKNDLYSDSSNKFTTKFISGALISLASGHEGEIFLNQPNYASTDDPVKVSPETEYTWNGMNIFPFEMNATVAFYDANMKYISYAGGFFSKLEKQKFTFITPKNTANIRFMIRATGKQEEMANLDSWMLTKGNIWTEYEPLKIIRIPIKNIDVLSNTGENVSNFCLTNGVVKPYMDEVIYDDDYSYTKLRTYSNQVGYYNFSRPYPVLIKWIPVENILQQSIRISTQNPTVVSNALLYEVPVGVSKISVYNLIPNTKYRYVVTITKTDGSSENIKEGSFNTTSDQLRMLKIDDILNVRDIGGWKVGEKRLKYGLIYRGQEFNNTGSRHSISNAGIAEITRHIGVRVDLDFRSLTEAKITDSPLGKPVEWHNKPIGMYENALKNLDSAKQVASAFSVIANSISQNKPVYMHCQGGRDRTGTMAFLIEGVCGVSESDLAKDYELTEFATPAIGSGVDAGTKRNSAEYTGLVNYIKSFEGISLKEKIYNALIKAGVNQRDIETIRTVLINN